MNNVWGILKYSPFIHTYTCVYILSLDHTLSTSCMQRADGKILMPLSYLADYKSELREQLPLIAGSAAAGVVFVVSLVAISIVCSR